MSSIYGIPNQNFIHCTRELKLRPIHKYAKENFGNYRTALGIRADEPKRLSFKKGIIYPLASFLEIDKTFILEWWKKQNFDLEIPEHLGNCVGCYKKSNKKLHQIASEMPEAFDSWIIAENKYGLNEYGEKRKIYRGYRTAYEVQNNLNLPNILSEEEECAEECGSVYPELTKKIEKTLFN